MNRQRLLLVVSGPSGSGKDTVVRHMIGAHPGEIELSVSATTRPPRAGESEGVDYHFISQAEFEQRIAAGELLEYARYVENYYGTLKSEVENRFERGISCVLVIDVQGAAQVKKTYPDCTTVFIVPPSQEELERRLRARGSENEARVQKRLARAAEEMQLAGGYDFTLVNNSVGICAADLYQILQQRQAVEKGPAPEF